MDIEFHYYMTYLIAARSGFDPGTALTIATAAQSVDDNSMIFEVDKGKASAYRNYISQTINILKPKHKLMRIYSIFHFVPGDPMFKGAERLDGSMSWLNTTPDSSNARRFLATALKADDPYRIGVACHAYADTWAHQNFVGYYHPFNAMTGLLKEVSPNIGHADAGHDPDFPALVWPDPRMRGKRRRVDNRARFLEAAAKMFGRLRKHVDRKCSAKDIKAEAAKLVADLDGAIGPQDKKDEMKKERIARYRELAEKKAYGKTSLPEYAKHAWLTYAVDIDVRFLPDHKAGALLRVDPFPDRYSWHDKARRKTTDWYRFQEAVKAHQADAMEILGETTAKHVELDKETL